MRRRNFTLRLQPSLLEELRKAADAQGVPLNQLINLAVAEKLSVLRTEEYFQERSRRADQVQTVRILEKAGRDNSPLPGDEFPPSAVITRDKPSEALPKMWTRKKVVQEKRRSMRKS